MRPHTSWAALLIGAALLLPTLATASIAGPAPDPPLCTVKAEATPSLLPGFYRVTIALRPDCPRNAVADVRLESYLGGQYPRRGWFRITRTQPLIRTGVPWYWRGSWRKGNGEPFPFVIPGLEAP